MLSLRSNFVKLLLIAAPIIFQSCAGITSSRKVAVSSETSEAQVYLNDSKIEDVEKNGRVKLKAMDTVIGADAPGYRRKNVVVKAESFNPMFLANFWPAVVFPVAFSGELSSSEMVIGVGGYTGLNLFLELVTGWRIKQHAGAYMIPALDALPDNPSQQHFFVMDNTEINFEKGDVTYEFFTNEKKAAKDKARFEVSSSEDRVKELSPGLQGHLNDLLVECGFLSSDEKFKPSFANCLKLDCKIEAVNLRQISRIYTATISTTWVLKDYYGQVLQTIETKGESNPFIYFDDLEIILNDGLEASLVEFLSDRTVIDLLVNRNATLADTRASWEPIPMFAPKLSGSKMSEFTEAAVTVVNDKGGHCSGLAISEDGYIITAISNLAGANAPKVILHDESEYAAEIVRQDPEFDLALIKIETGSRKLKTLKLNMEGDIPLGQELYSIGTPAELELGQSVSKGIVSGQRDMDGKPLMQTDIAASPGSNGGPLLDKSGMVYGIMHNKAVGFGVEGISFALTMKSAIDRLKISLR